MDVLPFGSLVAGDAVGKRSIQLVPLRSTALSVSLLTYGASLHTVDAPDRHGHRAPIHLSMPTAGDYEDRARNAYLGATCGRYANRIAGARFAIEGRPVVLESNDGLHHLHGGPDGFARRVWDLVEATQLDDGGRATFSLESPDGDQGYPGCVHATATYELHGHQLRITYTATTDAPTVVNLTNHAYWNLAGPSSWSLDRSIADHELRVPAQQVLPVDREQIPAGPLTPVDATGLDLRHPRLLLDLLNPGDGIDHSFAIPPHDAHDAHHGLRFAAELHHPTSGRTLSVSTDQPAIHVYTGNRLGAPFGRQAGVCLEAQHFPDVPNRPELGSAVLRPGEHYQAVTELTFGAR
jgi:aldose 1-epimerase